MPEREIKIGVVSASQRKRSAAFQCFFERIGDAAMIEAVGQREDRSTRQRVITPYDYYGVPYPLHVAREKALGLIDFLKRDKRRLKVNLDVDYYIVNDTIWEVRGFALNKGYSEGEDKVETLFNFYYHTARDKKNGGTPIRNEGGLAAINTRDLSFRLFRVSLDSGVLNPDVDPETLRNTIDEFKDSAGGLTLFDAFDRRIIIPAEPILAEVVPYEQVNDDLVALEEFALRAELFYPRQRFELNYLSQGLFPPPL